MSYLYEAYAGVPGIHLAPLLPAHAISTASCPVTPAMLPNSGGKYIFVSSGKSYAISSAYGEVFCRQLAYPFLTIATPHMAHPGGLLPAISERKAGSLIKMYAPTTISRTLADLQDLEKTLTHLPPLMEILQAWHTACLPGADQQFTLREQAPGTAALPGTGLRLPYDIAAGQISSSQAGENRFDRYKRPLQQRLLLRRAIQSSMAIQATLPPGIPVQKTIALGPAGKLILSPCAGTQVLGRSQLRSLTEALSLARRTIKRCTPIPATCERVQEFEMLSGLVSPFLRPQRPLRLAALALISWPKCWEEQALEVIFSLSLRESLLLPLRCLKAILLHYTGQAHPQLPPVQPDHEEILALSLGKDAEINALQQGGVTLCHT